MQRSREPRKSKHQRTGIVPSPSAERTTRRSRSRCHLRILSGVPHHAAKVCFDVDTRAPEVSELTDPRTAARVRRIVAALDAHHNWVTTLLCASINRGTEFDPRCVVCGVSSTTARIDFEVVNTPFTIGFNIDRLVHVRTWAVLAGAVKKKKKKKEEGQGEQKSEF